MQTFRYFLVLLALGAMAVWASETWFWFIPPPDLTPALFLLSIALYSVLAASALRAVIWTGVRGWPAAFLGGAILGYLAEAVIVATMYDNFPLQVVVTPLAWHALISGGMVLAL